MFGKCDLIVGVSHLATAYRRIRASHLKEAARILTPERPSVLVVDDERVVADTLVTILRGSDFNATATYSGESAVAIARESTPHFLVCDIVLDGISGIEAAIQIRALCPDCRIILISGRPSGGDLLDVARAQGREFEVLGKPFHPTELIYKLRA